MDHLTPLLFALPLERVELAGQARDLGSHGLCFFLPQQQQHDESLGPTLDLSCGTAHPAHGVRVLTQLPRLVFIAAAAAVGRRLRGTVGAGSRRISTRRRQQTHELVHVLRSEGQAARTGVALIDHGR